MGEGSERIKEGTVMREISMTEKRYNCEGLSTTKGALNQWKNALLDLPLPGD
jgi:hypothetical protein